MAARITTGAHVVDLRDGTRGGLSRAERSRISKRTRTQLDKLQRALAADPLDAVRDNLIGRIARKELIAQRAEVGLLAAAEQPPGGQVPPGAQFAVWVWNSLRRDAELLVLLEREVARRREGRTLHDYLAERAAAPAVPPAQIAQTAEGENGEGGA